MGNSQTADLKSIITEQTLENINLGVVFVNNEEVVTLYNKVAESILGIEKSKVMNRRFSENFSDTAFIFSIKEALQKKHSVDIQQLKINPKKDLEVEATYLQNKGLIIQIRDVTANRKHELISKRKSRMQDLGDMASMVAHEVRNPLGGIKGFASLLERDLKEQPKLQKMASHIVKGTDGLNEIVSLVMNYSKPLEGDFNQTNLIEIVEGLKQYVDRSTLTLDYQIKEVFLLLNEVAFKQAMFNLLTNAQEAMPNGGEIKLKIDIEDDEAILTLSDTGCGISEDNLKKVFTPFFTTRPEGKGFGLSEAHKIVQAHNGGMEVDSIVDQGTTFTIKLPIIKE